MAGLTPGEIEDWSWGEVLLLVQCRQKALRQHYQSLSVIAWQQAVLAARVMGGDNPEPVYALFPFWEEEEQERLRLAGYRAMMERLAGRGGA